VRQFVRCALVAVLAVGAVLAPLPASADDGDIEIAVEITPRPDCTADCASPSGSDSLGTTGSDPAPVLLTALSLGTAGFLLVALDRRRRAHSSRDAARS